MALNAPGTGLFEQAPLRAPLNLTVRGEYVLNDAAVTGADTPTSFADVTYNCGDWTAISSTFYGNLNRVDFWFNEQQITCESPKRIYCLEQ